MITRRASLASLLREVAPAAGSGWRIGAPVQVTLTLTLNQAVPGFRLTDPLPGAVGAVTALRLTPLTTPTPDAATPLLLGAGAGTGGVQFRLGPLPAGTYRLNYTARLEQAGAFSLLPAFGVAPDAPEWWVRSGGRTLTVER